MKRVRGRLSFVALNEKIELNGKAYLCFYGDGERFEGHLETADQCQYGLIGNKQNDINLSQILLDPKEKESLSGVYKLTVVDHEEGVEYILDQVAYFNGGTRVLESEHVNFKADSTFRGHRADLLIQQYLSPKLLGLNLNVYSGLINIKHTRDSPSLSYIERMPWLM